MKIIFTTFLFAITFNVFAQLPNYVPSNGLLGWYPFNGNANDFSTNQINGIPTNVTLTTDRNGNANSAYLFHQNDSYIKLNDTTNVAHYSISCWLSSFSYGDTGMIFCKASMGSQGFYTMRGFWEGILSTRHQFSNSSSGICETWNNYAYTDSTWHYLTVTYNGINIITYVDAAPIDTFICGVNISSQNVKYIGGAPNSDWNCVWNGTNLCGMGLDGKIDDFGFWNRALTPQEITTLYNTSLLTDVESVNKNVIGIYPNPTSDHITINYGNLSLTNRYRVKITNTLGQTVFTTSINQQQSIVDLSVWSGNGLYFVHVIDAANNTMDIRKIVLK